MSSSIDLLARLERAEEHVRQARQLWEARIGEPCAACLHQLQEAASELQQAQAVVSGGALAPAAKARLKRLRRDLASLGKLVDAAMAFCRAVAPSAGIDVAAQTVAEA